MQTYMHALVPSTSVVCVVLLLTGVGTAAALQAAAPVRLGQKSVYAFVATMAWKWSLTC
jgi:hypothetical protein